MAIVVAAVAAAAVAGVWTNERSCDMATKDFAFRAVVVAAWIGTSWTRRGAAAAVQAVRYTADCNCPCCHRTRRR